MPFPSSGVTQESLQLLGSGSLGANLRAYISVPLAGKSLLTRAGFFYVILPASGTSRPAFVIASGLIRSPGQNIILSSTSVSSSTVIEIYATWNTRSFPWSVATY